MAKVVISFWSIAIVDLCRIWKYYNTLPHCGIIFQLGYNSGHISNPFSPSFIPIVWNALPPFILYGQELKSRYFGSTVKGSLKSKILVSKYSTLPWYRESLWCKVYTEWKSVTMKKGGFPRSLLSPTPLILRLLFSPVLLFLPGVFELRIQFFHRTQILDQKIMHNLEFKRWSYF